MFRKSALLCLSLTCLTGQLFPAKPGSVQAGLAEPVTIQLINPDRLTPLDSRLDDAGRLIKDSPAWWVSLKPVKAARESSTAALKKTLRNKGRFEVPPGHYRRVAVPAELTAQGIVADGRSEVWYRRTFILEKNPERQLSIKLGEINDRDRVYLNGVMVASTGDWQAADAQAYDRQRIYELPPRLLKKGLNIMHVHVKGYLENEVGIYRSNTLIGPSYTLLAGFNRDNTLQTGILMLYLGVALYFIFLFVRLKKQRENLFFGVFVMALVVYHLLRTQYKYDLPLSFALLKKIQYTDLFTLVPLFFYFIRYYYIEEPSKFIRRLDVFYAVLTILLLAVYTALLFIDYLYTWEMANRLIMQPAWLVYIAAVLGILTVAIRAGNRDALAMSGGILIVIAAAVVDVLTSQNILNLPTMLTWGFIFFVVTIAFVLANRFVTIQKEVENLNTDLLHTNTAYERFVPRQFLSYLGRSNITDVVIGDQVQKEMTILFSDIRDFTSLSETMTPQENFNFLNSYLKHVSPIVSDNHGFIDKYIGDAVMALFPDSPADALKAAVAMQNDVAAYNKDRAERGLREISIGIGIHLGKLMLGTIGTSDRMEGTVISDAVNFTARLEGMTKLFGAGIITSDRALQSADGAAGFNTRCLGSIQVKGKSEPYAVFEVLDGLAEEQFNLRMKTAEDFTRGLDHYRQQNFTRAVEAFKRVIKENSADRAAAFYLEKLGQLADQGTVTNWQGVIQLDTK